MPSRVDSPGEAALALQIRALGLPEPEREYRFNPERRWRADFAWPDRKVLVEVEGGSWAGGRHNRGAGFAADCTKYNWAVTHGWMVLRFTTEMVTSGDAMQGLAAVLREVCK